MGKREELMCDRSFWGREETKEDDKETFVGAILGNIALFGTSENDNV